MWLARKGQSRGFVATAQAFFDMSKEWYSGRMEENWVVPTPAEREALLERHGFTGEFWQLG